MLKRRVAGYLVLFFSTFFIISGFYYGKYFPFPQSTPSGATGLIGRIEWYKTHASEFDLVFVGDSRTYCGVHPFLIDPILGTNSINLAQFAHWFPTQYAMMEDLLPITPDGATVVWSIGHVNYFPSTEIQRVYPVGIANGLKYLWWGVPLGDLDDNILYYNPLTHLFADRSTARQRIIDYSNKPLGVTTGSENVRLTSNAGLRSKHIPDSCLNEGDLSCIQDHWRADERFSDLTVVEDSAGVLNSVVLYTARGSYYRIELLPEFFRKKQNEMAPSAMTDMQASAWGMPEPHPAFWRIFEEILQISKKRHIRLIVNEIEEAPFMYPHVAVKQRWRDFMRKNVQKRVEMEGFVYVRTDLDLLQSDDYFDFNHLNSRGSVKFALMLAQAIYPYLK